jgi:hypothetical protein
MTDDPALIAKRLIRIAAMSITFVYAAIGFWVVLAGPYPIWLLAMPLGQTITACLAVRAELEKEER